MKITFYDILNLYENSEHVYICRALEEEYDYSVNTSEVLRKIGIAMYGPFDGRIKYYFKQFATAHTASLQELYPDLHIKMKLNVSPTNDKFSKEWRNYRIAVLEYMATHYPEIQFSTTSRW